MNVSVDRPKVPAHVPPELVLHYPLCARTVVYENPYDTLIAKVHEGPKIFFSTEVFPIRQGGWVVRDADYLREIYNDNEHFSKKGFTQMAAMIGEDWDVIPTELDPPRHTGFRRALNGLFTPNKLAELEGKVRERARELVAGFKDRGECDFVKDFATPYPVMIFLELLGLPVDRMEEFLVWENQILHSADQEQRQSGVRAVKAVLLEAIEDKRKNPGTDLITNALNLEVEGKPISDIEVFGHCFNLYIGGLDTVASMLGWHFYHLAAHPDFQRQLRADPALLKGAIEELLRAYAVTTTFRICTREYNIGGVTFKPGDRVAMATPLAARDPGQYDSPNDIRVDRKPRHLTFGSGIHSCLGLHLARREILVAMEEMFAAVPEFRIKAGERVPFFVGSIHHLQALPIEW
jgi:cytochrome P450